MGGERTIGGPVPRGVEVLINKAAIDTSFKKQLLADRHGAADAIALELTPSENFLLSAIPNPQLEMIIDKTVVPEEHRPAFLGKVAQVMLLAIATMALNSCYQPLTDGIRPDKPMPAPTKKTEDPKLDGKPADGSPNAISSPKGGSRPDRPSRGIQPDRPLPKPEEPKP
jgi:hypothetical protein